RVSRTRCSPFSVASARFRIATRWGACKSAPIARAILAASRKLMSTAMQGWPQRHRISVEHFYRMADAGLFGADERVELVDGEVIDMPPMASPHATVVQQLTRLLCAALPMEVIVRPQLPVRLGEYSEPLPDIA